MDNPFGTDEECAAAALIGTAGKILRSNNRGVPEDFVAELFAHAVVEDLIRHDPNELAELADSIWLSLAERKRGAPKIRFQSHADPVGAERGRSGSVIEIVDDEMPFQVESVLAELAERGIDIRFVVHPTFTVARDDSGRLVAFNGTRAAEEEWREGAWPEIVIAIKVERIDEEAHRAEIVAAIEQVIADVRICVADWRAMVSRVGEVAAEIKAHPPPVPVAEVAEAIDLLDWLPGNNFTYLGIRDYRFTAAEDALEPVLESGLGLLRAPGTQLAQSRNQLLVSTPRMRALLTVSKAAVRSRVHRRVYMDHVGVKRFDRDGKLVGEFHIVGLLTSAAYISPTRAIPYLRFKVDAVVKRAGFDPESHFGKRLVKVLDNYPRDELFQLDDDTLYRFAMAVLQLEERPRVRVLARRDLFDRFVSAMVYVPRARYDDAVRRTVGDYLAAVYEGHVSAFHPFFPEGPLVRLHFIIARSPRAASNPDRGTLERAIEAIVHTWVDTLGEELARTYDEVEARALLQRYRHAFSQGYRESYSPTTAVGDIRVIEGLSPIRPLGADFYRRTSDPSKSVGLKVWSHDRPIPLSERVPVLESMGFKAIDERTYHIVGPSDAGAIDVWLHDMLLERADGGPVDLEGSKSRLEADFLTIMQGGGEAIAARGRMRTRLTVPTAKIFVSYRRVEAIACWPIVRALKKRYGEKSVFHDASIPPGEDFLDFIHDVLMHSRILIVVIGGRWYEKLDDGSAKIGRTDDPVRFEIELALQRDIEIIPVLVEDAKMPQDKHLPESLQRFARRNALPISLLDDFDRHMNERLIPKLNQSLGEG